MKHCSYKIFLFAFLLSFYGCEKVYITDNERLLVKGKIVDQNGDPLSNIYVVTSAENKTIAHARTDSDGNFEFTSLNADNNNFYFLVNAKYGNIFENENPNYPVRVYKSETPNTSLKLDYGTITLNDLGGFSLMLKNLPGDENSLQYKISYTTIICHLPLEPGGNNTCETDQIIEGNLTASSENRTFQSESIVGTHAIFEYSLNGMPVQTIEYPVTNPQTNYVFEF